MTFFDKLIGKKEESEGDGISSLDEVPLNEEKRDMIKGIVDLSETTVKEVMVPRVDVEAFPVDIPHDELVKTLLQIRHSRFPVYQDTIDNIVGVLYEYNADWYGAERRYRYDYGCRDVTAGNFPRTCPRSIGTGG